MLPSSGKKGGRGHKTYLFGPLVELASKLQRIQRIFCTLSHFLPEDGKITQLPKYHFIILQFRRYTKSKELFYTR
jgi:predicted secreted protein